MRYKRRSEKGREKSWLDSLKDWPKFQSVAVLAESGLPIVPSFLVTEDSGEVREEFKKILERWGDRKVTIRTESKGGSVGGAAIQNCPTEEAWGKVAPFLKAGKMVMIIGKEGGDIFHNNYNVNIHLADLNTAWLEIVGPGFRSTDLNKRGINHETVKITWDDQGTRAEKIFQISNEEYRKSVNALLAVYRSKLGEDYLEKLKGLKATLLLHQDVYEPIGEELLRAIFGLIPSMKKATRMMELEGEGAIFSMSFIQREGLTPIFWDIYGFGEHAGRVREIEAKSASVSRKGEPKSGLAYLKFQQSKRPGA